MRVSFILIGLLFCTYSFGQNCLCEKDTILKEIINCDTIKFDNRAKLYWNFNCDSSWLTFESSTKKKNVIFSLGDGLQEFTGRLGFIYAQEYKQTFLIQNNVISGCCDPPEYYLFNKFTGQIIDSLGSLIFYSEDKTFPLIIRLSNNNDSLVVYNIDKRKNYFIKLPKAIEAGEEMFPEHLFDEPIRKMTTLLLTYSYRKPKAENDTYTRTLTIDLKKYSR